MAAIKTKMTFVSTVVLDSGEHVELDCAFDTCSVSNILENDEGFGFLVHDPEGWGYWEEPEGMILALVDRDGQAAVHEARSNVPDDWKVFLVECYEHGQVHYSVKDSRWYPDRQWDVGVRGFIALDPEWGGCETDDDWRRVANGWLQEYSDYCNGDCYGIVRYYRDGNGGWAEDSCWGYIGYDNAASELHAMMGTKTP